MRGFDKASGFDKARTRKKGVSVACVRKSVSVSKVKEKERS